MVYNLQQIRQGSWAVCEPNIQSGTFTKLQKATINFVMLVCLYGITRLPADGCSLNFTFEDLKKNCQENSSVIKNVTRIMDTLHEDLCTFMTISCRILRMRNVSNWSCRENQTQFRFSNFFSENKLEKGGTAGQATSGNIMPCRKAWFACRITKARIWKHT